jgi:hypothetical protein
VHSGIVLETKGKGYVLSRTNNKLSIKVSSPTDAQFDSNKNNFKFALKLTLKTTTCFIVKHHHQGAHCLSLAKFTVFKMC